MRLTPGGEAGVHRRCLTGLPALCHLQASARERGNQGAAAGISGGSHSASRAVSAKISLGCVPAVSLSPLASTLAPWQDSPTCLHGRRGGPADLQPCDRLLQGEAEL